LELPRFDESPWIERPIADRPLEASDEPPCEMTFRCVPPLPAADEKLRERLLWAVPLERLLPDEMLRDAPPDEIMLRGEEALFDEKLRVGDALPAEKFREDAPAEEMLRDDEPPPDDMLRPEPPLLWRLADRPPPEPPPLLPLSAAKPSANAKEAVNKPVSTNRNPVGDTILMFRTSPRSAPGAPNGQ
jgi:hypothetical protein